EAVIDDSYRVLAKRFSTLDADVYTAEPVACGPQVLIAVLRERIEEGAPIHDLFAREARALCRFTHPGVTDTFDFGVHQGRPYVVTSLSIGESFAAEMDKLRNTPERAVKAIATLHAAVDALHAAGLSHGSLGP